MLKRKVDASSDSRETELYKDKVWVVVSKKWKTIAVFMLMKVTFLKVV